MSIFSNTTALPTEPEAETQARVAHVRKALSPYQADLIKLSDYIHELAELPGEEYKSAEALTEYLSAHGFTVESGIADLPTAFRAVYEQGTGGTSFGFLAEYDALEKIGHGCGHHMQGPSVIGAALALKDLAGTTPLKIVIYGTPAEEAFGGKIVMQEKGYFTDIDVALMMHAADTTSVDVKCMAMENYIVTFHGKASHAAMTPEEGRSAFDAVLLSFNGIEFLREHVKEDTRIHYTVRDAGGAPNVVPDTAVAEYTLRSYSTDYLESIVTRFKNILKGAALMTDTTFTLKRDLPFKAKIPCHTLNDLVMRQAVASGAPQIAPPREKTGSTDFGNVMYEVPGTCIRCAFVDPGVAAHSTEYVSAGTTERGHKALLSGSVILGAACVAMLDHPEYLATITEEFNANKNKG